jgi:hypothetical protein
MSPRKRPANVVKLITVLEIIPKWMAGVYMLVVVWLALNGAEK